MSHVFQDPDLAELDRIWPLGRQLVVPDDGMIIVAGAYEGRYLRYLSELFPAAAIRGYEPQAYAYRRAAQVGNTIVHNVGLGTAKRKMILGNHGTDGATVVAPVGTLVDVDVVDAVEELQSYRAGIDLAVWNLEGSEWALIPYLLDEMMHHRIRSMAIQFHPQYVSIERCNRVVSYIREYYTQEYFDWPHWCYFVRKD